MNLNLSLNRHSLVLKNSLLGLEQVLYDGREVSSKRTMGGAIHVFDVEEDGSKAHYEVEFALRWHGMSAYATIRRNGMIVYSDK